MAGASAYKVIQLGFFGTALDPTEGNTIAENASSLDGHVFGSAADPLCRHIDHMAPVGTPGTLYRTDNSLFNDQFTIDGGAPRTFDTNVQANITLTYRDGTTATINTALFQDTAGNLYLVPAITAGGAQTALTIKPIESLLIVNVTNNNNTGMNVVREAGTSFICMAAGTLIWTPDTQVAVEDLVPGDLVLTKDHGAQPILWVGTESEEARGRGMPVLIEKGAMGNSRDLVVSQQHRMLVDGAKVGCRQGHGEYLVASKKLLNGVTIKLLRGGMFTYYHLLLPKHEIIFAEGTPVESFYIGRESWRHLTDVDRDEISALFPDLQFCENGESNYSPLARPKGSFRRPPKPQSPRSKRAMEHAEH